MVWRPTRRSRRVREAKTKVRWPTRRPGRLTRRSVRGWETHPKVQEGLKDRPKGLGGPPGGLGEIGRPTWRSRRNRLAHTKVQEAHPKVWER